MTEHPETKFDRNYWQEKTSELLDLVKSAASAGVSTDQSDRLIQAADIAMEMHRINTDNPPRQFVPKPARVAEVAVDMTHSPDASASRAVAVAKKQRSQERTR